MSKLPTNFLLLAPTLCIRGAWICYLWKREEKAHEPKWEKNESGKIQHNANCFLPTRRRLGLGMAYTHKIYIILSFSSMYLATCLVLYNWYISIFLSLRFPCFLFCIDGLLLCILWAFVYWVCILSKQFKRVVCIGWCICSVCTAVIICKTI